MRTIQLECTVHHSDMLETRASSPSMSHNDTITPLTSSGKIVVSLTIGIPLVVISMILPVVLVYVDALRHRRHL